MQTAITRDNAVQAISGNEIVPVDLPNDPVPVVEITQPEFVGVGGQVDLDSL